jgi:sarcosine oxidase subunit alpha
MESSKLKNLVRIVIDGEPREVPEGMSLAAAMLSLGIDSFRKSSVMGEVRAPLCGMGICFDCRVMVGGEEHVRSCLVAAEDGMEVRTER